MKKPPGKIVRGRNLASFRKVLLFVAYEVS
jgi:hypothetical protein